MKKMDMSDTCNFDYFELARKQECGEISDGDFVQWYGDHCAKCVFMSEICMYGELMRGALNELPEL